MMFREEWRQNVDFVKKRHIMMFPVMLALVSMVVTVGLRFLTGDAGIESAYDTMKAADAQSAKAFTWDELKVGLHLSLFMFSLGMGSFAFVGRNMVSQRASGKSYLLASPALLPLELPPVYLAYYLKEVAFYLCLILTPVVGGMALGILFGTAYWNFSPSSLVLNPGCTELYVGHHDAGVGSVILCQCNLVSFSLWVVLDSNYCSHCGCYRRPRLRTT